MLDCKFEIKLVQQSPMLHFQHNHQGATLRGSEVKPKLDRFLLKKLGGFDAVYDAHPDWFIGCGPKTNKSDIKPALNYKLRFACERVETGETPKYGLYYGNMGIRNEADKLRYTVGDCVMTVVCFIPELARLVKDNAREFFAVSNFGRMSGKGFGSFVVEGRYDERYIADAMCSATGAPVCYYFDCGSVADKFKESIFKSIKTLYSVMKSGYNINGTYHRSFLFEYFHTKNIGNEKAYMKQKQISPWENGKPVQSKERAYSEQNVDEYNYVRAMLGTGEHIDYITGFQPDGRPNREKLKVSIKSDSIECFPSPMIFKIVDNKVYFAARRINSQVFGKEFEFKNSRGAAVKLKTPSSFDIDEFMEYFAANYDPDAKGYGIGCSINKYRCGGDR